MESARAGAAVAMVALKSRQLNFQCFYYFCLYSCKYTRLFNTVVLYNMLLCQNFFDESLALLILISHNNYTLKNYDELIFN